MFEVIEYYRTQIEASDVLEREGLKAGEFIVVSLHREENVDNAQSLGQLLDGLSRLSEEKSLDVLVSTHPRTRKRLEEFNLLEAVGSRVTFAKPFGFHDYNMLQMTAACAISDSGTISEESSILGFPAVTPREWIERPEALDAGSVLMTGLDPDAVLRGVEYSMQFGAPAGIPSEYKISNCSDRVVRVLIGRSRSLRITQR